MVPTRTPDTCTNPEGADMLNAILRFSLDNRIVILTLALGIALVWLALH